MTYGSGFEAESGEDAQGDAPTPSADAATASAAAGSVFRQSHRSRLVRDHNKMLRPSANAEGPTERILLQ